MSHVKTIGKPYAGIRTHGLNGALRKWSLRATAPKDYQ